MTSNMQAAAPVDEEENIDYDALYGDIPYNADEYKRPESLQKDFAKMYKEIAQQSIKETLIGIGGAYGDLAELAGVNKNTNEERDQRDFETLSKLDEDQPASNLSFADIESLGEDPIAPRQSRLPTSENLRDVNEMIGGPGDPETSEGKGAARFGKLYGAGLAFGQVNPIPAIAGGAAGQLAEEAGGGPLVQAAAEIVTLLATQGRSAVSGASSHNKEVQAIINELRQAGYTDEQITLAINSAHKGGLAKKIASKSAATEEAFENFTTRSQELVSDILTSEVPGIEHGIENVKSVASQAYGEVVQRGAGLVIRDSSPFIDAATRVVQRVRNTLGRNPEAEPFLNRLHDAVLASTQNPTADTFINFYKELNALGKWVGPAERDVLITQVKNGIKDTFRRSGNQGRELAKDFEQVNAGIQKAYRAEELMEVITKTATTEGGIDFSKLHKAFDKPDNVHLAEQVLGTAQTRNLQRISSISKQVKDFDKSWKVANASKLGTAADFARIGGAAYSIYTGDWKALAAVVASKGGSAVVKKIAEKSLTDPAFQNILIKGMHAIKTESPRLMASANKALEEYLEEQDIDFEYEAESESK